VCLVGEETKPLLQSNTIKFNKQNGVDVSLGARPLLERNAIRENQQYGIHAHDAAFGAYTKNELSGNVKAGVCIGSLSNPTLKNNRLSGGPGYGVMVCDGGEGTLDTNDIFRHAAGELHVTTKGDPTVLNNNLFEVRLFTFLFSLVSLSSLWLPSNSLSLTFSCVWCNAGLAWGVCAQGELRNVPQEPYLRPRLLLRDGVDCFHAFV
jgi:parallel beta-helix repeat protein